MNKLLKLVVQLFSFLVGQLISALVFRFKLQNFTVYSRAVFKPCVLIQLSFDPFNGFDRRGIKLDRGIGEIIVVKNDFSVADKSV